jgi:predicted  nucleic acid-binding Zn-ribbon protein
MVSNEEALKNLTPEERLKALLFQYSKLYARWSEDREVFNKGMADQEEVLNHFTQKLKKLEEQIGQFEELEPHVRQKLVETVKISINTMVDSINEKIGHSVTLAIDKSVKKLDEEIEAICRAVRVHRQEMQGSQIKNFSS